MCRLRTCLRVCCFGLLLALGSAGWAFSLPKVPGAPRLPGLDLPGFDDILGALLKEEPPVSTSLEDANTAAPLLDGYEPAEFANGLEMPRQDDGSWLLPPGAYEFNIESYCLHAGTYGPGGGDGYLLAPLKGSRAGVIDTILQNTWRFPDLPQPDVQTLIWAIEARTRLDQMPEQAQAAARQLLSPEQLQQINGATLFDRLGSNGAIPDSVLQRVMDKLPAELQAPFQAQARIRNLMVTGSPTFDQLEELAVLAGDPGGEPGEVPAGQWSWHPNRYFVRYFPQGYNHTRVQVLVPGDYRLERDALGRIASLTDPDGWRVETEYDDTAEPFVVPGAPTVKGHDFRLIRFIGPDPERPGETLTVEIPNRGWTFVGRPETPRSTEEAAARYGLVFAAVSSGGVRYAGNWRDRAQEWKDRYDGAKEQYDKVNKTRERWNRWNEHGDDSAVDDLTDIKHYEDGMEAATQGDLSEKADWIEEHLNRVRRAWEWAANELAGGDGRSDGDGQGANNQGRNRGRFGAGGVATPGNRGRQRLGQSQRGF